MVPDHPTETEEGEALRRRSALNMAIARMLYDGDSAGCVARAFGLDVDELQAAYAKDRRVLEAEALRALKEWRAADREYGALLTESIATTDAGGRLGDDWVERMEELHTAVAEKSDALRSAADALARETEG